MDTTPQDSGRGLSQFRHGAAATQAAARAEPRAETDVLGTLLEFVDSCLCGEDARLTAVSDRAVRRQIDLAIGRALTDPAYAAALLDDPSTVLGEIRPTPEQAQLGRVRSLSLRELAIELHALFWSMPPRF
jgi:hypothetical protein